MNPLLKSTRCPSCGRAVDLPESHAGPFRSVKLPDEELVVATIEAEENRKPRYLLYAFAMLGPMFLLGGLVTVYYVLTSGPTHNNVRSGDVTQQKKTVRARPAASKEVPVSQEPIRRPAAENMPATEPAQTTTDRPAAEPMPQPMPAPTPQAAPRTTTPPQTTAPPMTPPKTSTPRPVTPPKPIPKAQGLSKLRLD